MTYSSCMFLLIWQQDLRDGYGFNLCCGCRGWTCTCKGQDADSCSCQCPARYWGQVVPQHPRNMAISTCSVAHIACSCHEMGGVNVLERQRKAAKQPAGAVLSSQCQQRRKPHDLQRDQPGAVQGRDGCLLHYLVLCSDATALFLWYLRSGFLSMLLGCLWCCHGTGFCLPPFQVMQRSQLNPSREELQFRACCRCCRVSFPFPPVVQPGQHLGSCKALVSAQLPSTLPGQQHCTCLCCAEAASMLSRAAKSQGGEGRDASLPDEAELGGCRGTRWLGFRHACDELSVAV